MKKILLFIFILMIISGCSFFKTIDYEDKISDNDDTVEKELDSKYYDCSFTKTYRIVNKLEDYKASVDEFDYIVVDNYLSFVPVVIVIPKGEKEKLEEGKYYEFKYTLKGNGKIEDISDIDFYLQGFVSIPEQNLSGLVVDLEIKNTEKVGLEQINEEICEN